MSAFDALVRERLAQVYDPCSVAAGRPLSLLDMGLARGWTLDANGVLEVTFAVTFAGCTMAPHFMQAAADLLRALPGVARVETRVDVGFEWTPEHMSVPAAPMRGEPQAWKSR